MNNIWFGSDFHFGHKNIVRGVSNWRDENGNPSPGPRDFDTLEEHNQALIDNINNNVRENDTLYCLGDWSFGGRENIWNFRKQLKVKTIHLILGNHDHHIKSNRALPNVYHDEYNGSLMDGAPEPENFMLEVSPDEIFSSVSTLKEKKIADTYFVMCHYAMRTWNLAHKGAVHLYGHSHGSLPDYVAGNTWVKNTGGDSEYLDKPIFYKSMDVGVDTHPEFRPYNIDEIFEIMKDRVSLTEDHHNPSILQ